MNQAIVSSDLNTIIALDKSGVSIGDFDFLRAGHVANLDVIAYFHSAGYDLKHTLIGACAAADDRNEDKDASRRAQEAVTWLIEHGVTPSVEALEQTIMSENRQVFDYLISSGADWSDSDVFIASCSVNDDYFARALVAKGVNINATCSIDGGNGLNSASAVGSSKVYQYLQTLGLESVTDNHGKYPSDQMITA